MQKVKLVVFICLPFKVIYCHSEQRMAHFETFKTLLTLTDFLYSQFDGKGLPGACTSCNFLPLHANRGVPAGAVFLDFKFVRFQRLMFAQAKS